MATFQDSRIPVLKWQDWLFIFAGANFVICGIISVLIGGDALRGHVTAGQYFLNDHGHFKEVDHGTFVFSQVYTFGSLCLLAIAALFRGLMRQQRNAAEAARARRVRWKYRWQS